MTALRDHRDDVKCACPRAQALECYQQRYGIDLDNPGDALDDQTCECECHRLREEDELALDEEDRSA